MRVHPHTSEAGAMSASTNTIVWSLSCVAVAASISDLSK